ncbi:enolase C-terminal domain-like protein [Jatrophihabitans sp.]|uniref:enolase C-terminal domain-like protein n=1 Tax=Jatrophihabitans sp. TaxID=1932789 RepID=UPI002CF628F9|nr:enolase C-terminal domain-like protein [Jatrophihabitans sp.]
MTRIEEVEVAVYRFPTPAPEADGTLCWDATTAVAVQLRAGGRTGLGWTYSSPAAAGVIRHHLVPVVERHDACDIARGWESMRRACRNLGTKGLGMQAVSAVDIAWWDLKARLLGVALTTLFGRCRDSVPVYGSGGFTTLSQAQLAEQVRGWQSAGCTAMKIKIGESWGSRVDRDLARVRQLRELAGPDVELMVDANGGYTCGQARRVGARLDELDVRWFEEPVSSDDVAGLAAVRAAVRCDVAAGEYAADCYDVRALLPVLDCLQLDATRCGGYTGWLRGAALAGAYNLQVSAHCAPSLHAPVAAAVPNLRHVEWFADHARLEPLLVAGAPVVSDGALRLESAGPGHGMSLRADAERWQAG